MDSDFQISLQHDEIVLLVKQRAENLFNNLKLCCSEALLLVLNHGFNGGLSAEQAKQLGAGFCGGMGEAGCTCGALSGAIMGLGLLVGPHSKNGLSKKRFRQLAGKMHDRFHEKFSSTCCRVLIKDFDRNSKARTHFCADLTGITAEIAVQLLLEACPHLVQQVQAAYLAGRDSKLSGLFRKLS
jgi:C_GCAxxG_C_C family probable redox protein